MNTLPARLLCAFAAFFIVLLPAHAQRMPQDNWYHHEDWRGGMGDPRGVALAADGTVYVADYDKDQIHVFDADGAFVRQWGSHGSGDGQLSRPCALALGTNGLLYVADSGNHRIQVFEPDGTPVQSWGSEGTEDGQFNYPYGLAVAADGTVYVADTHNHRVQAFTSDGSFLRTWGTEGTLPGEFEYPSGIAVGSDGLVYVTSWWGGRIQVFQPDGTFVRQWSWVDWFYEGGESLAIGNDGLIYVGGWSFSVYEPDGTKLKEFDSVDARGVAVDEAGTLYLAGDGKVSVYRRGYRTTGESPPNVASQPAVLSAAQRPGSTWMDIDYVVHDADSAAVTVGALAFMDGNNDLDSVIPMTTFVENSDTNLGANIPTGQERKLTWNVSADWNTAFGEVEVEVLANDGRDLVDFHFITIPSNGPDPELTISRSPVLDSDLLSCWYWLIATGDGAINLVSGKVYGVESPYVGAVLADTSATTSDGREFLFERMGVAEATADQVQRCKEASTPGTVNRWTPTFQVGPGDRPKQINEYGFDTGNWGSDARWVVPVR